MKEAIIEDEELGRLIVRVNLRAKSLVFRTKVMRYTFQSFRHNDERGKTGD